LCTLNSEGNSVTVAITATLYLLHAGHNVRTITYKSYKTALLDLEQQQNQQTENHNHSNRKKHKSVFTSVTTNYLQLSITSHVIKHNIIALKHQCTQNRTLTIMTTDSKQVNRKNTTLKGKTQVSV